MISIILNPRSGGASLRKAHARAEEASAWLDAGKLRGQVFVTEARGHARDLAAQSVARGDDLVVAWGGDGTVNEVASALARTAVPLAIVPAGSGNGLARDLRIPLASHAALEHARSSHVRSIDAGQLNGRWFFCAAGLGFDARVADVFDREAGGTRGLRSYVRLTARELFRYGAGDYRIGERTVQRAFLITFANASQFGNGARIAPDASLDDGLLDMVVFEERSRLTTIANVPKLFTGRIVDVPGVTIRRISETVVNADAPMAVHVDGEPAQGGSEIRVKVEQRVLKVVAREGA